MKDEGRVSAEALKWKHICVSEKKQEGWCGWSRMSREESGDKRNQRGREGEEAFQTTTGTPASTWSEMGNHLGR